MSESGETKSKTCALAVLSLFLAIVASFLLLLFGVPIFLCWIPGKAAYSLADLLLGLSFSLCEYVHPCLMLLIVPFLAICAVVLGHVARRRLRHPRAGLTGKKLALTGLIMGYVCLPLCLISSAVTYTLAGELWHSFEHLWHSFEHFEDFDESKQPWVECAIPLPGDLGRIVFMRRHIHPFLAEYDRKIRFETRSFSNMVKPLGLNCGGRTKINVYLYPAGNDKGPFVGLRDHLGAYYLDLQRGVVISIEDEEFASVFPYTAEQYLGRLDGTKSPLRFIPADSAPEDKIRTTY
jgi:hypothetical protein